MVNDSTLTIGDTSAQFSESVVLEEDNDEEWFFDNEIMRWKTRAKSQQEMEPKNTEPKLTEFEAKALEEARRVSSGDDDDDDDSMMLTVSYCLFCSSVAQEMPCCFARCQVDGRSGFARSSNQLFGSMHG